MKFLFLLFFISPIYSQTLQLGDEIPKFEYETQREEKKALSEEVKTLVFTSEMEASKIAHSLFEKEGEEYLKKNFVFFLSDIHKMPSLITRFVALPKMKKYNYSIHLIKESGQGDIFPKQKAMLTVLKLKNLKVLSINYAKDEIELRKLIE